MISWEDIPTDENSIVKSLQITPVIGISTDVLRICINPVEKQERKNRQTLKHIPNDFLRMEEELFKLRLSVDGKYLPVFVLLLHGQKQC